MSTITTYPLFLEVSDDLIRKSRFTVIAADDHPVVLRGSGDFTLLAEAVEAVSTPTAIEQTVPDLWMGGHDGIDLLLHSDPASPADREIQVPRLIGGGKGTAAVARMLNISAKTVGTHRGNLKNKFTAENSAELVQKAVLLVEPRVL